MLVVIMYLYFNINPPDFPQQETRRNTITAIQNDEWNCTSTKICISMDSYHKKLEFGNCVWTCPLCLYQSNKATHDCPHNEDDKESMITKSFANDNSRYPITNQTTSKRETIYSHNYQEKKNKKQKKKKKKNFNQN